MQHIPPLFCLIAFIIASNLPAGIAREIIWIAEGPAPFAFGDFSNPENWSAAIVPGVEDTAVIGSGTSINAVIRSDASVTLDGIRIGLPADNSDRSFELRVDGELAVNQIQIRAPDDATAWLIAGRGSRVNAASVEVGDPSSMGGAISTLWIDQSGTVVVDKGGIRFESAEGVGSVSRVWVHNNGVLDLVGAGEFPIEVVSGPALIDISGGFVHVEGRHSTFSTISERVEFTSFGTSDLELLKFEYDQQTDSTWITGLPPSPTEMAKPGDADLDDDFDQNDLVKVLQAGKYLTGRIATWGDGDWDGGPGGTLLNPPLGDQMFDQMDIIASLNQNWYLTAGEFRSQTADVVNVSEPAGILLVIAGAVACIALPLSPRHRVQRKNSRFLLGPTTPIASVKEGTMLTTTREVIGVTVALVIPASFALALGFQLGESKEKLKLEYDVSVYDHDTGRVTATFSLEGEGDLSPLIQSTCRSRVKKSTLAAGTNRISRSQWQLAMKPTSKSLESTFANLGCARLDPAEKRVFRRKARSNDLVLSFRTSERTCRQSKPAQEHKVINLPSAEASALPMSLVSRVDGGRCDRG